MQQSLCGAVDIFGCDGGVKSTFVSDQRMASGHLCAGKWDCVHGDGIVGFLHGIDYCILL